MKPLRSDDPRPRSVQFSHFGVLNDGGNSKSAFFTSTIFNVVVLLLAIVVGNAVRNEIKDRKDKLTTITLAPKEEAPKPPPPKIIPPKPLPEPPKIEPPKIQPPPVPLPPEIKPIVVPTPKVNLTPPAPKLVNAPPAPKVVQPGHEGLCRLGAKPRRESLTGAVGHEQPCQSDRNPCGFARQHEQWLRRNAPRKYR